MPLRYGALLLLLACLAAACSDRAEPERPDAATARPDSASPARPGAADPTDLLAAPSFSLPGPAGSFSLDDHAGDIVVLHFWATWNELSQDGLVALDTLHAQLGDDGVTFVGIAEDEDGLPALEAWAAGRDASPVPVVADTAGHVAEAYGEVELLPTTVVVDRQGTIRARHTGILTASDLLDLLGPVLIEDDEPLTDFDPDASPGVVQLLPADAVPNLIAAGAMLVDLRDEDARVREGAVPNAQHRPFARLDARDLPANFAVPVIFFGDVDEEAARAADLALEWGYVTVYRVEGGLQAWRDAGLPLQPITPVQAAPMVPARSVIG